jgi:FkbM family methyltransferase
MSNVFAFKTIKYIWSHPNCQKNRVSSVLKFIAWQLYKRLTKKFIDIELVDKVRIRCYPDSRSGSSVLYCGLYDYHDMNFVLRYLRPDDSFLDIGANIGVYTLLAASIIESGVIYAFEALPKNYARLEENLYINKFQQVKAYSLAISDYTGVTSLSLSEGDSMPFITKVSTNKTLQVNTDTLENLLVNTSKSTLTLAKIDIEGAELLALRGATSLLKEKCPKVWIMEINNTVNNFGHSKQEVVDLLKDYGYGVYRYNADINQVYLTSIDSQENDGNNFLLIAESELEFVKTRLQNISCTTKL